MKERTIRLTKKDWDHPDSTFNNPVRAAIFRELSSSLKNCDVAYGRIMGKIIEAVWRKVAERRILEKEFGEETATTDLQISFSLGEDSWKLKLGTLNWIQPRPRV